MSNTLMNGALETVTERRLRRLAFDGRLAIVLGGAGAIGAAVAVALAEHGADVAVLDVQQEHACQVAERIQALRQRACALPCDLQNTEQIHRAIDDTVRRFGRIDILINASGHGILRPLLEMTQSEFEENLSVFLTGTFLASQAVAKQMILQGSGGSIVHISSISSVRALGRGTGAYAAAKAGLNALVREMAVEWAPYGIRVNAVAPCQIKTPRLDRVLDSGLHGGRESLTQKMIAAIPMGRFGEPDEIVGPCLFMASSMASLVTGQTLFVDGGNTAQ